MNTGLFLWTHIRRKKQTPFNPHTLTHTHTHFPTQYRDPLERLPINLRSFIFRGNGWTQVKWGAEKLILSHINCSNTQKHWWSSQIIILNPGSPLSYVVFDSCCLACQLTNNRSRTITAQNPFRISLKFHPLEKAIGLTLNSRGSVSCVLLRQSLDNNTGTKSPSTPWGS